jgi:hypothetical protein
MGSYLHDLYDHGIQTFYRGGHRSEKFSLSALFGCWNAQNCRVLKLIVDAELALPMGINIKSMFLMFATEKCGRQLTRKPSAQTMVN